MCWGAVVAAQREVARPHRQGSSGMVVVEVVDRGDMVDGLDVVNGIRILAGGCAVLCWGG